MTHDENGAGGYIDSVRLETSAYIKGLIAEVDSLSREVVRLESVRELLASELEARIQREKTLGEKLEAVKNESQESLGRFKQLEQHHTNLANLYVATHQLHGTLDRAAVLEAIQEIVVNLVGSEDFALLERDLGTGELRLMAAVGPLGRAIGAEDEDVVRAVATGELHVSETPAHDPFPAAIPLVLDGHVVGVIAIRKLLSHKEEFDPLDRELFELLASHASTALVASGLRERFPIAGVTE